MSIEPRQLRRPVEVEPLPDARWTRIEHALFDAERRVWAPAEAPAAALSFRAAAALALAASLAIAIGLLGVRAFVQPAPGTPTRVETATNGSHVEFGESTVDVGPESSVRLVGDDARGVVVIVDRGRVECEVTPRHGRPPFLVQAGSVEVKVIGTRFTVVRTGSSATVDVAHGQVEVTSPEGKALVATGSHWPTEAPTDTRSQGPSQAAPEASSLDPAPVVPVTPSTSAAPPSPAPAAAAPSTPWASTPTPRLPRPLPSPRTRYEAASRLEATDPDAALAQYRELARQGGGWGQNALFAAGRLDADRGNADEARRLLTRYLSQYPSGANANDARELLHRMR